MKFVSRAYNNFELNQKTKSSVIKTSEEERLLGEIEYYNNLPKELSIFFPRVIDFNKSKPYSIELEYYGYRSLNCISHSIDFQEEIMEFIFNYIDCYKKHCIPGNTQDIHSMLVDKTYDEYKKLLNIDFFNNIKHKNIVLNSKNLLPFETIWDKIKTLCEYKVDDFYFIHGDLCFSNILYGNNPHTNDIILKFIDPRGVYGNTKFYGDVYYDLAKISHSCSGGYEFFINDMFEIVEKNNQYNLVYYTKDDKFNEIFKRYVMERGYDYKRIKLIEGLIFIGMCARHYDSFKRQKAMYFTGLKILNEIYECL